MLWWPGDRSGRWVQVHRRCGQFLDPSSRKWFNRSAVVFCSRVGFHTPGSKVDVDLDISVIHLGDVIHQGGALVSGRSDLLSIDDNVTVLGSFQWKASFWNPIDQQVRMFQTLNNALNISSKPSKWSMNSTESQTTILQWAVHPNYLCKSPEVLPSTQHLLFLSIFSLPSSPNGILTRLSLKRVVSGYDCVMDDEETYHLNITNDVEEYLITNKVRCIVWHQLEFVAFDDNDALSGNHFGISSVLLQPLVHNSAINSVFFLQVINFY